MNFPDAQINRVHEHKNREFSIQFKIKPEDITKEQKDLIREHYRDGTLFAVVMEPYELKTDGMIVDNLTTPKEKTVYEKLRWEVVKNKPEEDKDSIWTEFKLQAAQKKGIDIFSSKIQITSKDVWTEQEAQKELNKFLGL